MAPNPSLFEHQGIILQTYVFSLPSAERRKLDLLWSAPTSKLVQICSLVTEHHAVTDLNNMEI